MGSRLHYLFDPLCGWCYGVAPLIDAAAELPGLEIEVHRGEMLSGLNPPAVHSSTRTLSGPRRAVKHPHEVHHDFKRNWLRSLAFTLTEGASHLRRFSQPSRSSRTASAAKSSSITASGLALSSIRVLRSGGPVSPR